MCKAFTSTLTGVKRPRLLKTLDSSALLPLVDERTRTQSLSSGENRGQNKRTREDESVDFTPMTKRSTPHSAAPLQSELESRGHKRQREEDDSPESLKTKKKNYSTQGSSEKVVTISLLSDDDDEVIILTPTTPPDRGYGKRPAGSKPHKRKTGSKK